MVFQETRGGAEREGERLTATFTLDGDLPPWLEHTGGGFSSARRRRGTVDEWEEERKQMSERSGFQRVSRLITVEMSSV
jgi:hypothetical protein